MTFIEIGKLLLNSSRIRVTLSNQSWLEYDRAYHSDNVRIQMDVGRRRLPESDSVWTPLSFRATATANRLRLSLNNGQPHPTSLPPSPCHDVSKSSRITLSHLHLPCKLSVSLKQLKEHSHSAMNSLITTLRSPFLNMSQDCQIHSKPNKTTIAIK